MDTRHIPNLDVFFAIAEHGTLRAAGKAIGLKPPAISHRLKVLEDGLGTKLFTRTTRSIELTDAGLLLLSRAGPARAEIDQALREVKGQADTEAGTLRLTIPFGAFRLTLASRLAEFRRIYPNIELDLSFEEAFVDLVAERFHAGIRLGGTIQNDMIAVRITPPLQDAFFASPEYLDEHGRPTKPSDLLNHNCIRYRYKSSRDFYPWRFKARRGAVSVAVSGGLVVDSFEAGMEAARTGLGIAQNFRQEIAADLESNQLETVLDRHTLQRPAFHLYYPREYAKLQILRALVDFLKG